VRYSFIRCLTVLSVGLLLLGPALASGQENRPSEYEVKAAFLFNFAKFVQWPASAVPPGASPIVIGVLGENPFHGDLQRTIENKKVDDHPLVARDLHSASEAAHCHILFICASEAGRLPEILDQLQGKSVLTVADMDHFTESGGMIRFVLRESRVRFEINNEAARRAKLKISSKLLALAIRAP